MNPDRWRQVSELYHAARGRGGRARAAFLTEACAGDETLRREVESLLAQPTSEGGFLAEPAAALAEQLINDPAMSVMSGRRLGVYHIQTLIDRGGMGEVYRARDTKLGRDVAIKILPRAFTVDPDRRARFEREARLLAALNHPHIATIYGTEESEGVHALVMELVEGETLAQRIGRGAMPMGEMLPIARQIADALEAAHEKGIIHRDLKPANIKMTSGGMVKVLDFGLAKGALGEDAPDSTHSPIMTVAGTRPGVILGTAAYMSPEQARGQAVDKRTDIWAFGCILYEMLTGRAAFARDTITDTLAAILERDPDWAALPGTTPAPIRRLLQHCLDKNPTRRLRDIGDARIDLDDALTVPLAGSDANTAAVHGQPNAGRRVLPWVIAVAALTAGSLALWTPWRSVPSSAPLRLSTELGIDASLATGLGAGAVLSPDGAVLAFVAQRNAGGTAQLYVRRLEQLQAVPLAGTDGAMNPFFSPDGQWIAFFADGKLKKIPVTGGVAVTLCDAPVTAPDSRGGAWGADGMIAFQPSAQAHAGLWGVSSAGGKPHRLTIPERDGTNQRWPQMLSGGKAVLFTANSSTSDFENANLVVQRLPAGSRTVVVQGGYYGRYVASGHLIYLHEGTLFAAPFDVDRLALTGPPVPALEGVAANPGSGGAQFAMSDTGTLVYLPGRSVNEDAPVMWMDRTGKTTLLRAMSAGWSWSDPQFAPDGRRLALTIHDSKQSDVWVYDWTRDTMSRLTFDPADDRSPVWTPDGRRIVFASRQADKATFNLYWRRADGTGDIQRLTYSKFHQIPTSWHPTGKFLAFYEGTRPQTDVDIMVLPMEGDEAAGWKPGKSTLFLSGPLNQFRASFSPDGRWLTYQSNESAVSEVYVRPFPGPGGVWQISTGGGGNPAWSRARQELFYSTPDQRIRVVPYTVEGDSFHAGQPRLWSEARFGPRPAGTGSFDLHPDGNRFALAKAAEMPGPRQDKVVLIFNFFDELRRIAPAKN